MKNLILLILFLCCCSFLCGQNISSKQQKWFYKKGQKEIKNGNKTIQKGQKRINIAKYKMTPKGKSIPLKGIALIKEGINFIETGVRQIEFGTWLKEVSKRSPLLIFFSIQKPIKAYAQALSTNWQQKWNQSLEENIRNNCLTAYQRQWLQGRKNQIMKEFNSEDAAYTPPYQKCGEKRSRKTWTKKTPVKRSMKKWTKIRSIDP